MREAIAERVACGVGQWNGMEWIGLQRKGTLHKLLVRCQIELSLALGVSRKGNSCSGNGSVDTEMMPTAKWKLSEA